MRAGALDRRITIQANATVIDQNGQPVPGWTTRATVWAQVKQTAGREFLAAEQILAEERAVFLIRWRGDIAATDRILWDGKTYDVKWAREIGRRQGLEITAEAMR